MYLQFYQLNRKPFSLLPDPEYLYFSQRHSLAFGMLEYGLQDDSGGFAVITGEVGSGKTTLINRLLSTIDKDKVVGVISHTHKEFGDLLPWVMMSYGLPYEGLDKVTLYQQFINFVNEEYKQGKRCLLIIDEAQNLDLETLEQLRMLTNVNSQQQKLKLILSGQPQLLSKLKSPDLDQFAQRVAIQYHLEALNKDEGQAYIKHRLNKSGGSEELFDEGAIIQIWYHSRGIPRVINNLCDLSLVYGFAEQKIKIDADIVRRVVQDRKHGGLFNGNQDNQMVTPAHLVVDGV